MYLGIDIGGTKTLVAALDDDGVIIERFKFPTPKAYADFKKELASSVANLSTKKFAGCGVGAPGRIDRKDGKVAALGNLPWKNAPVDDDITKLVGCEVIVDNDANLGGLSEAMILKSKYNRVLYVTIGTGIGTGIIINQRIDPAFADAEGGKMLLEHSGNLVEWESFASGKAISARYGKLAKEITSAKDWQHIAYDIAVGLIDLIAIVQPQVIVLGGGVSTYYERLIGPLEETLKKYETPLIPIPPIRQASRPEDAVIYGCYDLAKASNGNTRS